MAKTEKIKPNKPTKPEKPVLLEEPALPPAEPVDTRRMPGKAPRAEATPIEKQAERTKRVLEHQARREARVARTDKKPYEISLAQVNRRSIRPVR
jgi:hypothetical protein